MADLDETVKRLTVELPSPWRPVMLTSQRVRVGHGQMDGIEVLHIVDAFERLREIARDAKAIIESQAREIKRLTSSVSPNETVRGGYVLRR